MIKGIIVILLVLVLPYYVIIVIAKSETDYSWNKGNKRMQRLNTKKGFLRALIPFTYWIDYFKEMWENMPDE